MHASMSCTASYASCGLLRLDALAGHWTNPSLSHRKETSWLKTEYESFKTAQRRRLLLNNRYDPWCYWNPYSIVLILTKKKVSWLTGSLKLDLASTGLTEVQSFNLTWSIMPLSSYRPGLKVITYFTPTEIKRGSPLHFEGWTGTNLCVQGLPFTLVRKPHLEVTPSLWLWGNQGRDVVFWGLLNKIVLAKIFRSCCSGWNLVRGFGWIIGNWVIPVSFLLHPSCFPTPGVASKKPILWDKVP